MSNISYDFDLFGFRIWFSWRSWTCLFTTYNKENWIGRWLKTTNSKKLKLCYSSDDQRRVQIDRGQDVDIGRQHACKSRSNDIHQLNNKQRNIAWVYQARTLKNLFFADERNVTSMKKRRRQKEPCKMRDRTTTR